MQDDGITRTERDLAATPEEAWELLATPEGLEAWLADEVELGAVEPGAEGTLRDADGAERVVLVEEVEPGRRLALRWWPEDGEPAVVDLTLDEITGGSRLTITEIPLRVVGAPDLVPATWAPAGGGSAPEALAIAWR